MLAAEARAVLHSAHPGFSSSRFIHAVLLERTCIVEWIIGLFFFLVRGTGLLGIGYLYPGVEPFLRAALLSEDRLGWTCLALALAHVWSCATLYYRLRAAIASLGFVTACIVVGAFLAGATQSQMPIALVWLSLGLTELYLAYRLWLTRDAAKVVIQNHVGAS